MNFVICITPPINYSMQTSNSMKQRIIQIIFKIITKPLKNFLEK